MKTALPIFTSFLLLLPGCGAGAAVDDGVSTAPIEEGLGATQPEPSGEKDSDPDGDDSGDRDSSPNLPPSGAVDVEGSGGVSATDTLSSGGAGATDTLSSGGSSAHDQDAGAASASDGGVEFPYDGLGGVEVPVMLSSGACAPYNARPEESFTRKDWLHLSVSEATDALFEVMTGSWLGHAQTPEGWSPSEWTLSLELADDERYSAEVLEAPADTEGYVPPFYYGTTHSSPLQQWRLGVIARDGRGFGEIDVVFCRGGESCYLPAWQGELEDIEVSESGNRLRFLFTHENRYPVRYDLYRVCD